MFAEHIFLPGIVTGMISAPQLLISPVEALVVILSALALCCGVLWLVTGSISSTVSAQASSPNPRRSKAASGMKAPPRLREDIRISPRILDAARQKGRAPSLAKAR